MTYITDPEGTTYLASWRHDPGAGSCSFDSAEDAINWLAARQTIPLRSAADLLTRLASTGTGIGTVRLENGATISIERRVPEGAKARTPSQRKVAERERKRGAGYGLRQVWVHADDWQRAQKYLQRLNRQRAKASA